MPTSGFGAAARVDLRGEGFAPGCSTPVRRATAARAPRVTTTTTAAPIAPRDSRVEPRCGGLRGMPEHLRRARARGSAEGRTSGRPIGRPFGGCAALVRTRRRAGVSSTRRGRRRRATRSASKIPVWYASTTAWTRSRRPSLERMCVTWVFTVVSLMKSSWPICGVRQTQGDQPQDVALARAQVVELLRAATGVPSA